MALAALPQTPNGKVDRSALARIDVSKVLATNTNAAPHTSNQVVLAAAVLTVIADVLDVEQSTLDPSLPLMDLGVDSIVMAPPRMFVMAKRWRQ